MLRRVEHSGITVLRSTLLEDLGVPHAFTTRRGGASDRPRDSLDLDDSDAGRPDVAENYRRLLMAMGCPRAPVAAVRQVHGKEVLRVTASGGQWSLPTRDTPADGLVARASDDARTAAPLLAVRVADCAAVLIADAGGQTVAAVHAGWRGAVAGIVPTAVQLMATTWALHPGQLTAAIGPCIGPEHFEVGPEVAQAFEDAGLGSAVRRGEPGADRKPHVDLAAALGLQLTRAGLEPSRIDRADLCTYRDAQDFFSHRRDAGQTGRMLGIIGVGAPR